MKLTVGLWDALRITRALRAQRVDLHCLPHGELQAPDPSPAKRWREQIIPLDSLYLQKPPCSEHPLEVLVDSEGKAPRAQFMHISSLQSCLLPNGSFLKVNEETWIPCPELLFVLMGALLPPADHLALGLELCGEFSLDATHPTGGRATFGVPQATTVTEISSFLRDSSRIHLWGMKQAKRLSALISDDAWSPMEASVAVPLSLGIEDCGYGLGPITLNKRIRNSSKFSGSRLSRVPDILFTGTHIGLNYDGAGHLPLEAVANAGINLGMNPGDGYRERELASATRAVRNKFLDDRRRDRELLASGLQVIPITSEDLYEPGGLDQVAKWTISRIEAEGSRELGLQRAALRSPALTADRQELIWSLLPGPIGDRARAKRRAQSAPDRARRSLSSCVT